MQPSADIFSQQEEGRVSVRVLQELGQTLRVSFDATTEEPLPREMGLLLLRIALVQALERIAEEEAREGEEPPLCDDRTIEFAAA